MRGPAAAVSAALLGLGLLPGCGGSPTAAPPPVEPCPPTCPGSRSPLPPPTGSDPVEGNAAYDALVIEPEPGELARGGNDEDAELTGRAFSVVVPAGSRLRTRVVCQGRTTVSVTTAPESDAESELDCTETEPREVIVAEQQVHSAGTAYLVTVAAPAPVRWYVVLSAVAGPPS